NRIFDGFSQLGWLRQLAVHEGIENVILWMGPNNVLGTVVDLQIRSTPNDPGRRPHTLSHAERVDAKWNLWHPDDFRAEYQELIHRVDEIMARNKEGGWRVFVGNVPYLTICPLAKGVGQDFLIDGAHYFKYYVWFPFEEDLAQKGGPHLNLQQAL